MGFVNPCLIWEGYEGLRVHMISNNDCVLDTHYRVSTFFRPCGAVASTSRLIASEFGGSIPSAATFPSWHHRACGVMDSIAGFEPADPGSTPGTPSSITKETEK